MPCVLRSEDRPQGWLQAGFLMFVLRAAQTTQPGSQHPQASDPVVTRWPGAGPRVEGMLLRSASPGGGADTRPHQGVAPWAQTSAVLHPLCLQTSLSARRRDRPIAHPLPVDSSGTPGRARWGATAETGLSHQPIGPSDLRQPWRHVSASAHMGYSTPRSQGS